MTETLVPLFDHDLAARRRRTELLAFAGCAFGLTWGIAALLLLARATVERVTGTFDTASPLYYLAVFSPTLSAVALTLVRRGPAGLAELGRRVFRWRVRPRYYAMVLVGIPAVDLVARGLEQLQGGHPDWSLMLNGMAPTPWSQWYLVVPFLLLTLALDAGPLGEELGWRGVRAAPAAGRRRPPGGRGGRPRPGLGPVAPAGVRGGWHGAARHRHVDSRAGGRHDAGQHRDDLALSPYGRKCPGRRHSRAPMNNSTAAHLWSLDLVLAVPVAIMAVSLHRQHRPRAPRPR